MGAVNFKIVPEASVFRGDADFDGPGAQKYHFRRKNVLENIFKNIFRFFLGNIFPDEILSCQICSWPGAVSFFLGGRARKITPLVYPLIFKNFFGHETGRRGSYGNNS